MAATQPPSGDDAKSSGSVEQLLERLVSLNIADDAIGPSDSAPDFCLPSTAGDLVGLDDLLANGPVVVSFIRGEWCSVCRSEVDGLRDVYGQVRAAGAELAVITPEGGAKSAKLQRDKDLPFDLLCDLDLGVSATYGLLFRLPDNMHATYVSIDRDLPARYGHDGWLLPVPATYVVGTDGVIHAAHVDIDYRNRMDPDAILAALAALRR